MKETYRDIIAASLIILTIVITIFAFLDAAYKIRFAAFGALTLFGAMFAKRFPLPILLRIFFSIMYFAFVYTIDTN